MNIKLHIFLNVNTFTNFFVHSVPETSILLRRTKRSEICIWDKIDNNHNTIKSTFLSVRDISKLYSALIILSNIPALQAYRYKANIETKLS